MLSTAKVFSTIKPVKNSSPTCLAAASPSKPGMARSRASFSNFHPAYLKEEKVENKCERNPNDTPR